jgi:hypothetical protein
MREVVGSFSSMKTPHLPGHVWGKRIKEAISLAGHFKFELLAISQPYHNVL